MTNQVRTRRLIIALVLCIAVLCTLLPAFGENVKIGLIYSKEKASTLKSGKDGLKNYRDAVEAAGGKVVELSQGEDPLKVREKMKETQGLLIPGGDDVDPAFYDESRHPKLETVDRDFDEFEFMVIKYYYDNELPILGICRGIQILNVFRAGTLYQDIPSQYKGEITIPHRIKKNGKTQPCYHIITIHKESLFSRIMKGKYSIKVNSYHHQAVKDPGKNLTICAVTEDGLAEAIESTNDSPALGVQFHPEKMLKEDPTMLEIFKWLVDEAGKKQEKQESK